jgi:hypothetical protein
VTETGRFFFDHANNMALTLDAFRALGERGFTLADMMVEHPGRQECYFIHFSGRGRGQSDLLGRQYLEYVHVADKAATIQLAREECKDFDTQFPNGMSDDDFYTTGLSLSCSSRLADVFSEKKSLVEKAGLEFSHKNYDWKNDSESLLPGWNFVTFPDASTGGMVFWITEYEPNPSLDMAETRKKREPWSLHPNGCEAVEGVIVALDEPAMATIADFCDLPKEPDRAVWRLADGGRIWSLSALRGDLGLSPLFRKKRAVCAVVLVCRDLEHFRASANPDYEMILDGQPALGISLGDFNYDIIVVQG